MEAGAGFAVGSQAGYANETVALSAFCDVVSAQFKPGEQATKLSVTEAAGRIQGVSQSAIRFENSNRCRDTDYEQGLGRT